MSTLINADKEYLEWVKDVVARYRQSQIKAAVKVNRELLAFYWSLGKDIVNLKADSKWGEKFFKNLSADLSAKLPDVRCFSVTNLMYVKYFYETYNQFFAIHPQLGDKLEAALFSIPWGHHKVLLLIEMGSGFAYMGREYRIVAGETEQFMDLLFYNTFAHCYVVVEVKTTKFEGSFLGQLSTYVSCVNHILKREGDNPTIGLLICKSKDDVYAQYSLEGYNQPLGISGFEGVNILPDNYKHSLPSIEEIEKELKEK